MRGRKPNMDTSTKDKDAITRLLPPPNWLSREAKDEWKRVFPVVLDRQIITVADLGSLESYCLAIGQVKITERTLRKEGYTYKTVAGIKRHPATAIQSDAMTRARLLAAELGLTPVSRSRPAVRDDDDADSLLD